MAAGWAQAVAGFRAALRFFGRHYLVIAGFGVLASAQRFLAVAGGESFAFAGGVGGEVFTALVRVAFLVWLVRVLFREVPSVPWRAMGPRLSRFVDDHVPMLLASAAMLVGLTIVFKVIPDAFAAGLPEEQRSTFLAWELAVKNVTVIPFVMVWLTTIAREALRLPEEASAPAETRSR